jgi:hypothetical protein
MNNILSIKYGKIFGLFMAIILTICYLILNTARVSAQSVDLGIYPPVFQIQTTPPSNVTTPFSIQNFADSSVDLTISLKPFTAAPEENGTVSFLNDLSSYPDPSLLGRIYVFDGNESIQTITLAPQQKRNLTLVIEIPKDEVKGEYYMALTFTSNNKNAINSSSSQASAGIASNILLSVGPLGKTQGYIEDFSAPPFTAKGPVAFSVKVKNTSDHYITPKGDIIITNMFGQNVGKISLLPVNILSNTIRRMPDSVQANKDSKDYARIQAIVEKNQFPVAVWPEKFLVGPYTATLTLALSNNGPLFKKSIIFFAFPSEYLLVILAIVIAIVFIILRVKRRIS